MAPEVRPHVVVHVAVSLEGATAGFDVDLGRFYGLAGTWDEDVTLAGADTILAQEPALAEAQRRGPDPKGPLLAVVDAGARVREWEALAEAGYWSRVLALRSASTPARPEERWPVEEVSVGEERVDLAGALQRLGRDYSAHTVRVESGGSLNGALLARGLVDEVSLLVHPRLAGAQGHRLWHGSASQRPESLDLLETRTYEGGLVWLRYAVLRP